MTCCFGQHVGSEVSMTTQMMYTSKHGKTKLFTYVQHTPYICICALTRYITCTQAHIHNPYTHAHIHVHKHTCTHPHTHAHTHTHIHMHTPTHTCKHKYTHAPPFPHCSPLSLLTLAESENFLCSSRSFITLCSELPTSITAESTCFNISFISPVT